jgi:membrane-associated phospholipid phosphatase
MSSVRYAHGSRVESRSVPDVVVTRPLPAGSDAPGPWWWTAVGLLLAVVAGLAFLVSGDSAVTRTDAEILRTVAAHRPAWLVDVARGVTLLGHGAILAVILVAVCVGLARRGALPPRAALLPPLALAVGGGLNPVLKALVDRPRPPIDLRITTELSPGFPSGHAAQSASAWVTLALALWLWGRSDRRWPLVALGALVAAIGVTRVVLAVHSPSDVLAGWAWGSAVALTVVGVAAYAERSGGPTSEASAAVRTASLDREPSPSPPADPLRRSTNSRCATTSGARNAAA